MLVACCCSIYLLSINLQLAADLSVPEQTKQTDLVCMYAYLEMRMDDEDEDLD